MNDRYGWISPHGKFVECELYSHFEKLARLPEFQEFMSSEIDSVTEGIQQVEDQCKELMDADEHPEWHNYEMAVDDARYYLVQLAYDKGFIRVGQNKGTLHFEGKPDFIHEKYDVCNKLAEEWNCHPVFEPRKS